MKSRIIPAAELLKHEKSERDRLVIGKIFKNALDSAREPVSLSIETNKPYFRDLQDRMRKYALALAEQRPNSEFYEELFKQMLIDFLVQEEINTARGKVSVETGETAVSDENRETLAQKYAKVLEEKREAAERKW